jgi:hypothetical protein
VISRYVTTLTRTSGEGTSLPGHLRCRAGEARIRLAALYVCAWYQPDGDDPRGVPQEGDIDKGEDPVEAGGWNPATRGTCSHPGLGVAV